MRESTSDYFVYHINPYPAVVQGFVGIVASVVLQLVARRYVTWFYWTINVMVAASGTMTADITHVVLGVQYVASTRTFSIGLGAVFVLRRVIEKTISADAITAGRRGLFTGRPSSLPSRAVRQREI